MATEHMSELEIVGDEIEHQVCSDGCDTSMLGLPHRVHVQTRGPDPERGDPGAIAEGTYTISGGVLRK
jgi:hypothetical protein